MPKKEVPSQVPLRRGYQPSGSAKGKLDNRHPPGHERRHQDDNGPDGKNSKDKKDVPEE